MSRSRPDCKTEEFSIRMSASKLGVDPTIVRAMREAGHRWCSWCRAWESVEHFSVRPDGRIPNRCRQAERARKRAARAAR